MKRILAKQTHYKSLINTLRRHPEFAEDKAQLPRMVAELETRENRMSEILSDICRPVAIFYAEKRQAENEMNKSMFRFTNLGRMAAYNKQDETMYALMKTYQEQLHKVSAYSLYLNALHVAELLQTIDTNLAGPDFHTRQLPEFRRQAEAFCTKLTALADQLRRRKALKQELAALIASTNLFLRDVMDNAVNFVQDLYPDFYREYHLIRQPHERKRRRNKKTQPVTQETSLKSLTVDDAKAKPSPIVASSEARFPRVEKTTDETGCRVLDETLKTDIKENTLAYEVPEGYMEQIEEWIKPGVHP